MGDFFKRATDALSRAKAAAGTAVTGVQQRVGAAAAGVRQKVVAGTQQARAAAQTAIAIRQVQTQLDQTANLINMFSKGAIIAGMIGAIIMIILSIYAAAGAPESLEVLKFMGGNTGSALVATIICIMFAIISFIGVSFVKQPDTNMITNNLPKSLSIIFFCAAVISGLVYYISDRVDKMAQSAGSAEQKAAALGAAVTASKTEGFADGAAAPATTFLGSQLMTIKQAGYLGPPNGGVFKPAEAVTNALRAGFRSFVLRIDSLVAAKDPAKFAAVGEPTLLYTTDSGSLLSANSGSIEEVAKAIYDHAFTPMMPNSEQHIFLYLHVARAPTATKEADKYKRFLSKIAKQLGPLAPYHLGMTPLGVFHRQKNQDALLAAPLTALKGQVIIATNANTDMFRTAAAAKPGEKPGAPAVNPAEDLDYWVNLRIYLEGEEPLGITLPPESDRQARAVVAPAASLLELKGPKADAFAQKGKQRFVIALAPAARNPTVAELDHLLNTLGVNVVGLDMFSDDLGTVKELLKTGYDHKSYRPKPAALQHSPPLK
jgi:hypothetical protein